jgi:outer membrane lipase/esterase
MSILRSIRRRFIPTLIFATSSVGLATTSIARPFDQFIGFGGSAIDSGWFIYKPPPAGVNGPLWTTAIANGGGKPTTPYGLMVSELLAAHFGLTAFPADRPGGGTNYAASGAQINAAFIVPHAPPVVAQIDNYLASAQGSANPKALYLISTGGDDITYATEQYRAGTFTLAQAQEWIISAARTLIDSIAKLSAAGVRYLLVPVGQQEVPGDPLYSASPLNLFALYRATLYDGLAARSIHFIPADRTILSGAIGADAAAFGLAFTLTTQPACINPSPVTIPRGWAAYCTPRLLISPNAGETHLYADLEHYTAAGQRILADYYISIVEALLASCQMSDDDQDRRVATTSLNSALGPRNRPPETVCDLWGPGGERR